MGAVVAIASSIAEDRKVVVRDGVVVKAWGGEGRVVSGLLVFLWRMVCVAWYYSLVFAVTSLPVSKLWVFENCQRFCT